MIYTMNYLDDHNFIEGGEELPVVADTLHVKNHLHFETFAALTGTCIEDLQKLNPSILHAAVPVSGKSVVINVPATAKEKLFADRIAILDSAASAGRKELEVIARAYAAQMEETRVVYKVRRGDVLGSIAIKHRVTVAQIKKWNNLRSNMIREGQLLKIYRKGAAPASSTVASNTTRQPLNGTHTYTVQPGDTLWTISRKFDGLTIEKIKSLNNLEGSKIQPGQKLILGI
jgi:membrane-bound lytic murein transglycosylase D